MSVTIGGITRTVALWVMIICAAIADTLLYIRGEMWWGSFWSVIIATVILYEIVCYVTQRKTISTQYRDFIKAHPVWGYTILAILCVSLNALIIHLAVW